MKRREILAAGAALLTAPAWVGAQSSAWPTRGPVKLVVGGEFVQLINSQIDTWRGVAKLANVEVIT